MRVCIIVLLGWIVTGFFPGSSFAVTPEKIFQQAAPSVVVIEVSDQNGKGISLGSGVVIAHGQVVTNCHVIENGDKVLLRQGQKTWSASLRYRDNERDLCQLEASGLESPPARLLDGKLATGQRVYAIGAPQGLELTISEGLISSLRDVDAMRYIQTTAAISPGSSGGGLFDSSGRLIGITTFYVAEGQNLNFALPVEWIADLPKRDVSVPIASTNESMDTPLDGLRLGPPEGESVPDWNHAMTLTRDEDWTGLLAHAKKWTRAHPKDSSAWESLGEAHLNLDQGAEAIPAFQEANRIKPVYKWAWLRWCQLGEAYSKDNQLDKAIHAYQKALRLRPKTTKAWIGLGNAYRKSDKRIKAIHAYKEALRMRPDSVDSWFGLGNIYADDKQYEKAKQANQEALRIAPTLPAIWNNFGTSLLGLNQPDKAIPAFQEALRLDPKDATAWFNLGVAFGNLNEPESEIQAYEEALRLDPEYVTAWLNLGVVFGDLHEPESEIQAYEEALRLDPGYESAWLNLGITYAKQNRREKVLEVYQMLRDLNSNKAEEFFKKVVLP